MVCPQLGSRPAGVFCPSWRSRRATVLLLLLLLLLLVFLLLQNHTRLYPLLTPFLHHPISRLSPYYDDEHHHDHHHHPTAAAFNDFIDPDQAYLKRMFHSGARPESASGPSAVSVPAAPNVTVFRGASPDLNLVGADPPSNSCVPFHAPGARGGSEDLRVPARDGRDDLGPPAGPRGVGEGVRA